jgi:hypothetical protein
MTNTSTWVAAADVGEFDRTTVTPLLSAEPTRNTLLLTVFDRLRNEGPHAFNERDPQMLTWYDASGDAAGRCCARRPTPSCSPTFRPRASNPS